MIISKPRIDREINEINNQIRREMREIYTTRVAEYKKAMRERIGNLDTSDLPIKLYAHIPKEHNSMQTDIKVVEDWLEENCTGSVLITHAPSEVYGWDGDDDLGIESDDEFDVTINIEEVVDEDPDDESSTYGGITSDRPTLKYPAYGFHFANADDAVKFKLYWGCL